MCAHLVIDLYNLNEDRERQAKEQVANLRPAVAVLLVHRDRRQESLPRLFLNIHCQRQRDGYRKIKVNRKKSFKERSHKIIKSSLNLQQ